MFRVTDPMVIDASASAAPPSDGQIINTIIREANRQRLHIAAITLGSSDILVYYSNTHYYLEADAIGRLTRILMANTPPKIERFRLVASVMSVPQREFTVLRMPMERIFGQDDAGQARTSGAITSAPAPLVAAYAPSDMHESYPRFSWSIFPQYRQAVTDSIQPYVSQVLLGVQGGVELFPGFSLNGEFESSLYDNLSSFQPSNSLLPHVRSDFASYIRDGRNGIGDLEANYRFRIAPDTFAIARAGILENMFAGAGGEVLWRPDGQRWAIGADAYQVWQRGFDRLLDVQHYQVFTGHVSLYYASPWYDLNFVARAGRYLAGDFGTTLEMSRRFASGVEIGVFGSFTDASSHRFGEGRFDKGIIIRIPLGWATPIASQSQIGIDLRPIQRDGGQRLTNDAILYNETRRTSDSDVFSHFDSFLHPN